MEQEPLSADEVVIVSGLPRSGTSMMMQMLAAGGVPVLADEFRQADEDNPRGYYELEAARKLRQDASWLNAFLGGGFDEKSMAAAVAPELRRQS